MSIRHCRSAAKSERSSVVYENILYYNLYNVNGRCVSVSLIACRVGSELEARLERAAAQTKRTKTDVIREALELYLQQRPMPNAKVPVGQRLSDVLSSDIGVWAGPATASERTGQQLGEILLEKHRTRRV